MNRWRMTCFRKGTLHSQKVLPLFAEYYQDGKTDMAEEIIIPMMPMMELPLRQLEHKS